MRSNSTIDEVYQSPFAIDHEGHLNKYGMLQYTFSGPEVDVKAKPHGNSKRATPYFRTSESTKQRIRELAAQTGPKSVVHKLTKEQGGEIQARGSAFLPRDRQQIANFRRSISKPKDTNVLYSIMLECKLTQGTGDAFIRDVKAAPEPQSVLFCDWQLEEVVRNCTNNRQFSVLTVDTTFNLGEFCVTPTTFYHMLLEDIKSGRHPVVIGPMLVHQRMQFATFNYFASTLIGSSKQLRFLQAFGTDGDENLVDAFSHSFPYAIQLRCFLHFKRNLQEKLCDFGIPKQEAQEFLFDIFGKSEGNVRMEGLVDCSSIVDFDSKFEALEETWNSRESPYSGHSGPRFFSYFRRYYAVVVRHHMRKDLREAVGLGSPPAILTTNASECVNSVLKKGVNYKESQWPEFVKRMKDVVDAQRDEIIRALSGRGQYRLCEQYRHLGVPLEEWNKMRPDQRQHIVGRFDSQQIGTRKPGNRSGVGTTKNPSIKSGSGADFRKGSNCVDPKQTLSDRELSDPKSSVHDEDARSEFRKEDSRSGFCEEGPRSGFYEEGPRSGFYEEGPRSGFYKEGPRSGFYEEGPRSGFYEEGPRSGFYEEGPRSGFYEEGPRSGFYEEGPRSGFFEEDPRGGVCSKDISRRITHPRSDVGGKEGNVCLSISADDCGIHTIPMVTLEGIWNKAMSLLNGDNSITVAPGPDKRARVVLSYRSETPHLVRPKGSTGQYVCDEKCPQWVSAKICSHTVAVAECNKSLNEFLKWYISSKTMPNITSLAMSGMPTRRGRKKSQAPRSRATKTVRASPDTIISAPPSLVSTAPVCASQSLLPSSNLPQPPPLIFVGQSNNCCNSSASSASTGQSSSMLSTSPPNTNPFYLKFITGNIRMCQGCRCSLHSDGAIPAQPYDLTVARAERRSYRDSSGNLITPSKPTTSYYHCRVDCIQAAEPHFIPRSLRVPADIYSRLSPVHREYLLAVFGLSL